MQDIRTTTLAVFALVFLPVMVSAFLLYLVFAAAQCGWRAGDQAVTWICS